MIMKDKTIIEMIYKHELLDGLISLLICFIGFLIGLPIGFLFAFIIGG